MGGLVRRVKDRRVWATGVALLALGVITSVVVAGAIAVLGPVNTRRGPLFRVAAIGPMSGMVWEGMRGTWYGREQCWFWPRYEVAGPAVRPPRWVRLPRNPTPVECNGYGWPVVCLTAWKEGAAASEHSYVVVQGWSASSGDIWLPATPAWGGLVVNTAFWSAAWWLVLAAPRQIRRRGRLRRGECVRCGYDLRGGGGVCPECGREPREGQDTGKPWRRGREAM